ncbi:MAG: hypothetical protein ACQEQL_06905 [Pseudomonadota bacterium]
MAKIKTNATPPNWATDIPAASNSYRLKIGKPTPGEEDVMSQWNDLDASDKIDFFYKFCARGTLWLIFTALHKSPGLLNYDCGEPLHTALRNQQKDAVLLLSACGADLDAASGLALRIAASQKDTDMMLLLTELGASPEIALKQAKNENNAIRIAIEDTLFLNRTVFKKQDDKRILRNTFLIQNNEMITCHTEFNFQARKIMTVLEKNEVLGTPVIEFFKDQETSAEILEAREELIKQGGNPESVIKHVPQTRISQLKRPK